MDNPEIQGQEPISKKNMDGDPFFSVIIPTYNRAHFIRRPTESVIAQTFQSWELIIVDDGSTDKTGQVVRSFDDPRIRYIYQENQERSAARNTGIKNAKGRYICFLDSDDYYLPTHLESFHKKIVSENYPMAVLYCDTIEDSEGKLTRFVSPPVKARNNVEWVVQMTLGTPRTCSHLSILEKHQFNPSITVGEDVELWTRVLKEFPVIYNEDHTVAFVTHPGRTIDMASEKASQSHISVMEKIFSNDRGNYISSEVRKKILSGSYLRLAQHYIHVRRNFKSARSLLCSLWIYPSHRTKEKIYLLLQQFYITNWLLSFRNNQT